MLPLARHESDEDEIMSIGEIGDVTHEIGPRFAGFCLTTILNNATSSNRNTGNKRNNPIL